MFAILNQSAAALWLGSWAPCGSVGAFESTTQLNSGQRESCLLFSSKHLWCPKNILEETGLRGHTPVRAPRAFLCPSSRSPSLQDTGLSFTPPPHSQFCLCDLYCVSVGALFPRSNQTTVAASRPSGQTLGLKTE